MTNHQMIKSAMTGYGGKTLTTAQMKSIVCKAYPKFSEGSLLPNDHALGNKNPCGCAGTSRRIFDRVERGVYRVRGEIF